jgi:aromatase
MAGHIDVRVKVAAPLDVLLEVANAVETTQTTATPADRHAAGHEIVQWNQDRNSIIYRINPGPDAADRTWEYQVERIVNKTDKTAYARRWGNENFLYSYAFWQYTGSGGNSELRCVADFELVPGAPMDDRQMEAFMSRGTQSAMEKTARAAEAEAARRSAAPSLG